MVSEQTLWSYLVQLASALKSIHSSGLAARVLDPKKIILTAKNRIRLSGCALLDVINFDDKTSLTELQQEDLAMLGQLILSLATNVPYASVSTNKQKLVEQMGRTYGERLCDCVSWLINPNAQALSHPWNTMYVKDIDALLVSIADQIMSAFDSSLHAEDNLLNELSGELENGRLVRLLAKLGTINERPEFEHSPQWSETGERYFLKLYRDYVFHQVDTDGAPVVDLGHMVTSLNKLDAGTEEKIRLISRDEQTSIIVSYREVKQAIQSSFAELVRTSGKA